MTSRTVESSSWPSTFNPYSPLQMLIIKSLLLAVFFLTLSILAAPIPLDPRDDALFSRGRSGKEAVARWMPYAPGKPLLPQRVLGQ